MFIADKMNQTFAALPKGT